MPTRRAAGLVTVTALMLSGACRTDKGGGTPSPSSGVDPDVPAEGGQITERISLTGADGQANGESLNSIVNAQAEYVGFESLATNLLPGDGNSNYDVFVRDLKAQSSIPVSVTDSGSAGNGASNDATLSADGRFASFESAADNLVAGDTNGVTDAFVRDLIQDTTIRASVSSSGEQTNASIQYPCITPDGRFVVFKSRASNLAPVSGTNILNIFVHDRTDRTTALVSRSTTGTAGNADSNNAGIQGVSEDGRLIAFSSEANNLVDGDTNGVSDIFVFNRVDGTTTLVSVSASHELANGPSSHPSLSPDGRFIAFVSRATNLLTGVGGGQAHIYVKDLTTGEVVLITESVSGGNADGNSTLPTLSADGEYVAFQSSATNLVGGDTNGVDDVFVYDREEGRMRRVSVSSDGIQGNGQSRTPWISADGRVVSFDSAASNLVEGDTNGVGDAFLWTWKGD